MRKFTFGLVFVALFIFLGSFYNDAVYAEEHKIEEIHMHVLIDDDGDAHVTNYRRGNFLEGTENFIVFRNLNNSTIEDIKVTEDGHQYEYVDNWDLQASLEEKAFKSGVIQTTDGIELSWGIGEYGRHEYVVEYVITNFIKQLDDGQMLYWHFINTDMTPPPEKVTIEIEASEPLTADNSQIWRYGYSGDIQLIDGKIVATSDEPLSQEDSVVLLAQFNNGMFAANDVINRPFAEFLNDFQFVSANVETTAPSTVTSEDITNQSNDTSTEHDSESVQNKWDDDDVHKDFGYLLKELLTAIFDFIKSLFP